MKKNSSLLVVALLFSCTNFPQLIGSNCIFSNLETQIDVSSLNSGVYFVRLKTYDNKEVIKKLVKE